MQHVSTQGWTLDDLLQKGERFHPVPRSSFGSDDLESQIKRHEESGTPFVIEGWHKHSSWSKKAFSVDFCLQYFKGKKEKINVRNVHTRQDKSMLFSEFVQRSRSVSTFAAPEESERWYGKDVECPREWEDWLVKEQVLPDKYLPEGSDDLFALRPKKNGRPDVETLMCYFGVGDTFTPCHKDLCASSGQNLMVCTEKDGSSFWFMTKSKDCSKVARYFQSLKRELDHETHVISISDLAKAPFEVYITEQKVGDLVLVPPRSCHQVLNYGGMTIKMSWSRMTFKGLCAALYHELPLYRRVCRPEIYQIKSTVHYTLCNFTQKLVDLAAQPFDSIQKSVMAQQLKEVLGLYDYILKQEYSNKGSSLVGMKDEANSINTDSGALKLADEMQTCDFCGADIFQSYFECRGKSPVRPDEAGFIICPGCFVEGRTCACRDMRERERQSFNILFNARWNAIQALIDVEPLPRSIKGTESLSEQRRYFAKPAEHSVFHAAMLLHSIRLNERQPSRQCRMKGESHALPSAWTLPCKKCHSARCYPHLLSGSRLHSMQALLLQELDPTTIKYHEAHLDGYREYPEDRKELLEFQAEGTACPNFTVLMTYNAITFKLCQPVNQRHAGLGWYDTLPERSRRTPAKATKKEEEPVPMDLDSEMEHAPNTRSPGTESQRSVRNHAYVELKQPERRKRNSGQKLHLSSPLSSPSGDPSDNDELDPDDDQPILPKSQNSPPKRKYEDTSDTEEGGSSTKHKLEPDESPSESTPARGVKKPAIARAVNRFSKRPDDSRANNDTSNGVFAPVFPVGPPKKRRRQEQEQSEGNAKNTEATGSTSSPIAKEKGKGKEETTFADSLGAAINQVREGATKVMRPSGSLSELRRKTESMRPARAVNPFVPPPPRTASSSSHNSQTRQASQAPIVVDVAQLQDMVVKTADSVVRQLCGEVPGILLAAHAAVSMMTGYAAAGQFTNNNTQLQFPSMDSFAGVSQILNAVNANMRNINSQNNQESTPGHQSRVPKMTGFNPAMPRTLQESEDAKEKEKHLRSSGGNRAQASSSAISDHDRQARLQAIRRTSSGESARRRARHAFESEEEDDEEV
ncbi:hypothetical protein NP233_g5586 [Leucocoprinus birnbaumii]|uniref:JmjC domain-containing protein n=1 Tax=Leucocoprinus birnbaumii TaxID=56174 RepID=A0AAD5VYQ1_9AGAR|nr:hypothetical protein NP233_g5586 [Leucocoprinus birnbaumii]